MNVGTLWKLPSEVVTRAIDFSSQLSGSETITSIQSVTATDSNGTDFSASIIGPAAPIILAGNKVVQIQMENGTLGQGYTIAVTVKTTAANIYQANLILFIGLPIDLTTVANVKSWVGIASAVTTDDQTIQDCITAFAAYVLHLTGRGGDGGAIPAISPFVSPVAYDEVYDGSGTMRQPIRNWPIVSVASVNVDGQAIPQSTSINVWGWVVDGDKKFISLRGGYSPSVATFQNYRYGRQGQLSRGQGFSAGIQNVEIQYTAGFNGVPFDLEMCARKVVGLNYKRRQWIGQRSQALAAGAGTVTYGTWEMETQDERTIQYYQRRVG